MNSGHSSDGPPPYRVIGHDRVAEWRSSVPGEAVEFEVALWLSGLYWDPWQAPSWQSTPPGDRVQEVRRATIPGTWVAVSYTVDPASKLVRILEVADLP